MEKTKQWEKKTAGLDSSLLLNNVLAMCRNGFLQAIVKITYIDYDPTQHIQRNVTYGFLVAQLSIDQSA